MPPKKAAKKAAKKSHAHHEETHHRAKDLRRAYEHLGRVEVLQYLLHGSSNEISTLVGAGQEAVLHGTSKNAADLLRAAEHLSFAAILDQHRKDPHISDALISTIRDEFDRLEEKAEEHFDWHGDPGPLAGIVRNTLKRAKAAREAGDYRQALELIRGAEALAHVKQHDKPKKHALKKGAARSNVRELAAS